MRKIRLLVSLAGEAFAHPPGTVLDVSDAEAARHVENENAVYVPDPSTGSGLGGEETATAEDREKAVKISRKR